MPVDHGLSPSIDLMHRERMLREARVAARKPPTVAQSRMRSVLNEHFLHEGGAQATAEIRRPRASAYNQMNQSTVFLNMTLPPPPGAKLSCWGQPPTITLNGHGDAAGQRGKRPPTAPASAVVVVPPASGIPPTTGIPPSTSMASNAVGVGDRSTLSRLSSAGSSSQLSISDAAGDRSACARLGPSSLSSSSLSRLRSVMTSGAPPVWRRRAIELELCAELERLRRLEHATAQELRRQRQVEHEARRFNERSGDAFANSRVNLGNTRGRHTRSSVDRIVFGRDIDRSEEVEDIKDDWGMKGPARYRDQRQMRSDADLAIFGRDLDTSDDGPARRTVQQRINASNIFVGTDAADVTTAERTERSLGRSHDRRLFQSETDLAIFGHHTDFEDNMPSWSRHT